MKTYWFEDKLTSKSKEYVLLTEAEEVITSLRDQLDGSPHSYIRQLKERIEGHIEENAALRKRQRLLVEVIDKVLDKVKENEHFFKYFRGDIRVKDLVQSLFELEAAKDGSCGISSAALAAKEK